MFLSALFFASRLYSIEKHFKVATMTRWLALLVAFFLAATWLFLNSEGTADKHEDAEESEAAASDGPSLNDLSLEVTALDTLYRLQLTRAQMEALQDLAQETAPKGASRQQAKGSAKLRKTLSELRDALVKADDDDRIAELAGQLDKIIDAEKPELDDEVEIGEEASAQAARVLRFLTPKQVAAYASGFGDDIPDPLVRIQESMETARDLDDKEWEKFRTEISTEIGRLLAGLDGDKAQESGDKVVQLLIIVRSLSDEEFEKQRPDLEEQAVKIVGDLAPTDVIRHVVEYHLAELLSNPRLPAALELRLK